MNFRTMEK